MSRIFAILLLTFLTSDLWAQNRNSTSYFEVMGMYFTTLPGYEAVSISEDNKLKEKGKKLLEETVKEKIDDQQTKGLLSIKKGAHDYLTINITPLSIYGTGWQKANEQTKNMVFTSFADKVGNVKMDSSSSQQKIDGVTFDRFQMNIDLQPAFILKMVMVSRPYQGYDLSIMYVSTSEQTTKEMEQMLAAIKLEATKIDQRVQR